MNLKDKRKKALAKLRSNRGKSPLEKESLVQAVKEGIDLFVKQEEDYEDSETEEVVDLSESDSEYTVPLENLPKIVKAQKKVASKQEKIRESSQRLKETREKIRQVRKQRQQIPQESEDLQQKDIPNNLEINTANRHQLKEYLLTADFWQQASQWLSSIDTDIHLSASPPEEIELLYKQVKHRYKALQLMLEDTQRELDAFEVYFRNLKTASESNKHD